ncbi:MAG TPA: hypothetical protein CFH82_02905 [Sulfurospirillum sp. UBA12182]|nr:MAG TPA: hypothetical protein CFH82_02905 [Sulfurospirillum sp. UBA12182]
MLSIFFVICALLVVLVGYYLKNTFMNNANKVQNIEDFEAKKDEGVANVIEPVEQKSLYIKPEKMRYWLYPSVRDLSFEFQILYDLVVVKNLWIDEPFHTKFYEIFLLLSKNNFMIRNPNSSDLILNMRDENDIVRTSTSYEVFSTNELLYATIEYSLDSIVGFYESDAKNIVFVIVLIICGKSQYFNQKELPLALIQDVLKEYSELENIWYILELIEAKDRRFDFIEKAYELAIQKAITYPYNDSTSPLHLQISSNLPKKVLKNI